MSWVKLDDLVTEHPKFLGLTDRAKWVWVQALCWCSRQRTDGFMPAEAIPQIAPRSTASTTQELVKAGLWERRNGGYQIHDFLDYQPSQADLEERQRQKSRAGQRGADSRWRKGDR